MSSSGARSGAAAKAVIDNVLVLRLTQFTVNPTSAESAWGDSDSAGWTNRIGGRKDATASLTGKFDTNRKVYAMWQAGDTVILALWESAADYWAFPRALCTSFTVTFNQDTKEVVEWSAEFGTDGVMYRPGEAGAPTYTLPSS